MTPEPCHLVNGNLEAACGGRITREAHSLWDCIVLGHERCGACIEVIRRRDKPKEPRVLVELSVVR